MSAAPPASRSATPSVISMETFFLTGIAIALVVYLVVAVVRPEKF
ncbi:MAG: potassium-transporting ATPase subunit F [Opitutaceae bacterium]|nr:potassium-transporting ATPase subunit F [Opitutaceae bacterium]